MADSTVYQKQCPGCKQIKGTSGFYKNTSKKDGCSSYCKECIQADNRKRFGPPRRVEYTKESISNEGWKPIDWIPDYENLYEVSDHGRVRRMAPGNRTWIGRFLRPQWGGSKRKGYMLQVTLSNNSGYQPKQKVHILVARAFIGLCPDGCEVNHKNGNRRDNRVDNLEYLTPAENQQHARDNCLHPRGKRLPQCKLEDEEIRQIRALIAEGFTNTEIGRRYHVNASQISRIRTASRRQYVD